MDDPQWFYSSLAQVTAALVGFLGSFLLLRMQTYIGEWRSQLILLQERQRQWRYAQGEYGQHRLQIYRKAMKEKAAPPDPDRAIERPAEEAWRELSALIARRNAEQFPTELTWLLAGLGVVLATGIVAPLVALGEPSNGEQRWYVGLLALFVALGGVFMHRTARTAFRAWKHFELSPEVEIALDDLAFREELAAERLASGQARRGATTSAADTGEDPGD